MVKLFPSPNIPTSLCRLQALCAVVVGFRRCGGFGLKETRDREQGTMDAVSGLGMFRLRK